MGPLMHPGVPAYCYVTKTKLEFRNNLFNSESTLNGFYITMTQHSSLTRNTSVLRTILTTRHKALEEQQTASRTLDITSLHHIYKYVLIGFTLFSYEDFSQHFILWFRREVLGECEQPPNDDL